MLQQGGKSRGSRLDVLLQKRAPAQQRSETQNPKWRVEDQALIDWFNMNWEKYESFFPHTGKGVGEDVRKHIACGPLGHRAQDRSLQKAILHLKNLVEQIKAQRNNDTM